MYFLESTLSRHSNNFDFVRLIAASMVLIGHSWSVMLKSGPEFLFFEKLLDVGLTKFGVLTFFVISGFLVTKSWEHRKSFFDFMVARILRIFPALIAVVLLSVFVLGPLLTSLPLTEYFLSPATHKYLQNITLYRVYYPLPGVFENSPFGVNASLWSLPYEFTCYLIIAAFGTLTLLRNKWTLLPLLILFILLQANFKEQISALIIPILGIDFKTFSPLLIYFIAGAVYYLLRKHIPYNAIGVLIAISLMHFFKEYDSIKFICLPYVIFAFAFWKLPFINHIGKYGDISYGIYLYAFPVQQLVFHFYHGEGITPLNMILLSFLFTIPCAIVSWVGIERPILKLRTAIFNYFST